MLLQGSVFSVPVGIEKDDLHAYCEDWIRPFFTIIYNNPEFKFFIYISGIVFEYLEKNSKESIDLLKEFSDRKQVEILHGMYYDAAPVLQPKSEQKAQLEKLSHYISSKNIDKVSSKGAWLTPSTYDQTIIGSIKGQGLEFIITDGAYLEPCLPPYEVGVIDSLGKRLFVLPYDDVVDFTYENMNLLEDIKEALITDGEKNIYKIIFTMRTPATDCKLFFRNYKNFLQELKKEKLHKYAMLPTEYIKQESVTKRVSRIRTSPFGVDEYKSFLNFLTSRYESRLLYSYFLYILKKISSFRNKQDKERRVTASMQLSQIQNHFVYWKHDTNWGIHNSVLRQHAYQSLGNIQENFNAKSSTSLLSTDFNLDGVNEIVLESSNMMSVLEPHFGSIVLLQKRQKKNKRWNYTSCYVPTPNPLFIPSSFREMLVPENEDISELHSCIMNQHYRYSLVTYENVLRDSAHASVTYETTSRKPVRLEKKYAFLRNNNINIEYNLSHNNEAVLDDTEHVNVLLITEINLSLTLSNLHEVEIMIDQNKIKSHEYIKNSVQEISFLCSHMLEKTTIQYNNETFGVSIIPVVGTDEINGNNIYQYHSILLYQPISLSRENCENRTLQVSFSAIRKK